MAKIKIKLFDLLIIISTVLVIFSGWFSNKFVSCQNDKNDKMVENQHFSSIQNSVIGALITTEILGKPASKEAKDTFMTSAEKSQQEFLNLLKDKSCNNKILWAQRLLIVGIVFNMIALIMKASSNGGEK